MHPDVQYQFNSDNITTHDCKCASNGPSMYGATTGPLEGFYSDGDLGNVSDGGCGSFNNNKESVWLLILHLLQDPIQ